MGSLGFHPHQALVRHPSTLPGWYQGRLGRKPGISPLPVVSLLYPPTLCLWTPHRSLYFHPHEAGQVTSSPPHWGGVRIFTVTQGHPHFIVSRDPVTTWNFHPIAMRHRLPQVSAEAEWGVWTSPPTWQEQGNKALSSMPAWSQTNPAKSESLRSRVSKHNLKVFIENCLACQERGRSPTEWKNN